MSTGTMNINEASKACGLSPSVLRIWELRYGWPSPKRKANGYRTYTIPQVEDLRRVSELVKHGTSISQLIIDGLPRWPTDQVQRKTPAGIHRAKTLPRPNGHLEAKLQSEIIDALERRQSSVVRELLQRAMWSVRPQEEVVTALAPVLVGLTEMESDDRSLPEAEVLRRLVQDRCAQLLRRYQGKAQTWVVPAASDDVSLASLVALVLCQRGEYAQPWLQAGKPANGVIVYAGQRKTAGSDRRITATGQSGESLADLLATTAVSERPVPSAN